MRKTDNFKDATYTQLRRVLRIINYYENKAGGPSLDWLLIWANGWEQAPEKPTEDTLNYWEKIIGNPNYYQKIWRAANPTKDATYQKKQREKIGDEEWKRRHNQWSRESKARKRENQ